MPTVDVIDPAQSRLVSLIGAIPEKAEILPLCIEYGDVYVMMIHSLNTIQRWNHCTDPLGNGMNFLTQDNSVIWQVEISEEYNDKTAFLLHYVLYLLMHIPF